MNFLRSLFCSKTRADVIIPLRDINIALRSQPDRLIPDDDYNDFVLRTVRAPRLKGAHTLRYSFNPDQRYLPDKHFNGGRPMRFYGSEGMLMTTYPGKGLAIILHDQIRTLHDNTPTRHVALAIDGHCNVENGTYHVHAIQTGSLDKRDRIYDLSPIMLTAGTAERAMAILALSMQQMLNGTRLTLRYTINQARYIDRKGLDSVLNSMYPAENLDNPAPNP